MVLIIELDVLDATIRGTQDTLVVLIVHLGGCDRLFCLDTSNHISVVRGHNLSVLVGVSNYCALATCDHNLSMSVNDAANSLRENEFLLAMFKPVKLALGIGCGVDGCDRSISCPKNNEFTLMGRWKSSGEAGTRKVSVLQVLIHLWLDIQDSLELNIVLPDDEVSLLADSHEINIVLRRVVGVNDNLVDTLVTKDRSTSLTDKSRIDIQHDQAVLFRDRAGNKETTTVAESHRLNTVAEESNLVQKLVLRNVKQVDDCVA